MIDGQTASATLSAVKVTPNNLPEPGCRNLDGQPGVE
jgi:hypothetical protein